MLIPKILLSRNNFILQKGETTERKSNLSFCKNKLSLTLIRKKTQRDNIIIIIIFIGL